MMQTDVKAKHLTSTAAAGIGPCRIRGIYYTCPVGGGSISFKNGGSGGTELILILAPTAASSQNVLIPAEGVLFSSDPYVTITTVESVTFFYG